jgi:hypothetical protein
MTKRRLQTIFDWNTVPARFIGVLDYCNKLLKIMQCPQLSNNDAQAFLLFWGEWSPAPSLTYM